MFPSASRELFGGHILRKWPKPLINFRHQRQPFAPRFFYRRITSNHTVQIQSSSPSAPIHSLDPKLPSVSVKRSDGSIARYNVSLTPKAKPEKVLPALDSLLNRKRKTAESWILDDKGDAIHRHLAFKDDGDAKTFLSMLMAAADEMKHHPHVTGEAIMTITCTTHNPQGLSMRDVRLATKVEELASQFEVDRLPPSSDDDTTSTSGIQRDQRLVNRAAIDKVLSDQSGACFDPEKRTR